MRTFIISALALLIAAPALAQTPAATPPDPIAAMVRTAPDWTDQFTTGKRADWVRHYSPWDTLQGRTLPGNKEEQVYVDAKFLGTDTLATADQFNTGGTAILLARRMDQWTRSRLLDRIAKDNVGEPYKSALTNATWMGALLKSTSMLGPYGYIEASIRLDVDPSAWPAFWMLPQTWGWPPEIDIVEWKFENGRWMAVMGIHSKQPGWQNKGCRVPVPNEGKGFHTYGFRWTKTEAVFYLDRKVSCRMAVPSDLHQPFYPILNIAMGGWGAKTTLTTKQPQGIQVDYVSFWKGPA